MREAIRSVQTFLRAPAFEEYIIKPWDQLGNRTSDEELDEYIQLLSGTGFHPTGTAAMSSEDADYGVVNPDLLVKKTSGLRIVDASVLVSMFCYDVSKYTTLMWFVAFHTLRTHNGTGIRIG